MMKWILSSVSKKRRKLKTDLLVRSHKASKITIYTTELEKVAIYGGFNDILRTFGITRGKSSVEKNEEPVAFVKAGICIYKPDKATTQFNQRGLNIGKGFFSGVTPIENTITFLVRVYVVRGYQLHTKERARKTEAYVQLVTHREIVTDRGSYHVRSNDPVFGRCYEAEIVLPFDSSIKVRVLDFDMFSADDLIGETRIDVENRFYSRHRGTCGLPEIYNVEGYNRWRDSSYPTEILEELCKTNNLSPPKYNDWSITVEGQRFHAKETKEDMKECLALSALNQWERVPVVGCNLVGEHIETRSLYNPDYPGIEQGKLEMWVDLLRLDGSEIPPPIDITPRQPVFYELRIVVWKCKGISLRTASLFENRKHIDLYVKCWMQGKVDLQETDVHFKSYSGEGIFNWRFIFNFYHYNETQMISFPKRRDREKVPPVVHIQVFDKERFRSDLLIGSLDLDLHRLPRPTLSRRNLQLVAVETLDLFRQKKIRGWWNVKEDPNLAKASTPISAGQIELELDLKRGKEAEMDPVGRGRNEPFSLPPPHRPKKPKSVLAAMCSPMRRLILYFIEYHKADILKCLAIVGIILFIALFVYAFPGMLAGEIVGPHRPHVND